MESCDPVGTPMEIKDKLDLDQNGTLVDATKYRSMIGALMYLTSSRYCTCYLFMCSDSGFELTEFLDADYAGCKDSFKSTSGGAQFLVTNGNPSRVNIKQLCGRIRQRRYNLIPPESKFKNPMLDHQDKYMMKAQVHVSKSSAISDEQALPQRKHHCFIIM
nr:hypothetical protein [Tanacetum cinerariifolium]